MCRRLFVALLVMLWALHCRTSLAATALRGFPVQLEGTVDTAPPLVLDIDADGRPEIVVGTRNKICALEADGSAVEGFPYAIERGALASALVAGPFAPEERPSLVFGTSDGHLLVIGADGKPRAGFPIETGPLAGAPALADLDADGRLEIIAGTQRGEIWALDSAGRSLPGYPARVGAAVSTAITTGQLSPSQPRVLLFGDEKGRLHAWTGPGKSLPGFPFEAKFSLAAQPVLGDIDDDGSLEIVVGSMDYKIYALESDGSLSAGYPASTGYRIYSSCALADLDGDGVVEVVAASGDGKLYALRAGRPVPGFPVKLGGRLRAAPVIADLDLDGKVEIVVGTDQNSLVVLRADGRRYPGFPAKLRDRVEVAPLLADLNGNGVLELLAASRDGSLYAFRMLKKGRSERLAAWPAEGRDARRSARTYPNPPRYVSLSIEQEAPRTVDPLELRYRFFDLDGEAEPDTIVRWYKNGKRVTALDGKRRVPADMTRKHQRWHFSLQASASGQVFHSQPVEIANSSPSPPKIGLLPDPARTGDGLEMKIERGSEDADGDRIRYRITWLKDHKPMRGFTRSKIAARHTAKGQQWTVVVTPQDGEVDGAPARASLTVVNTPPSAPEIRVLPAHPRVTDPLRVEIVRPGRDPDGDALRYLYAWSAAGRALNLPKEAEQLPAGFAVKHAEVKVAVRAFDGLERGGEVESGVRVENTPPTAPGIRIAPAEPRCTDDLRVEVAQPSSDPDQDAVHYRFSWQRKSRSYRGKHAARVRLPASETKKGETWVVTATPHDGEVAGRTASAEVTIVNSPPSSPRISSVEQRPVTTEPLRIRLDGKVVDPDGDPAWLEVHWSSDGKELGQGRDMLELPAHKTRKHGVYLARLVPTDGKDAGPESRRFFEVQNSPPGPCKITIRPAKPRTGQDLEVRIEGQAADADQDRIEMRYRWFRDGQPVQTPKGDRVEGSLVRRGQDWVVVGRAFDGEAEGPACTAEVSVVNSAPSSPRLAFVPASPRTGDELRLDIVEAARDPDSDPIAVHRRWKLDGKPYPAQGERIAGHCVRKGQCWGVEVMAEDGQLRSQPVRAEVVIGNSPPDRPALAIRPAEPLSSDDLRCHLLRATRDRDGDPVTHRYAWFQLESGDSIPEGAKAVHDGPVLPAARTRKGQRWACRAQALDGELSGEAAVESIRIGNAAPGTARVEIRPPAPREGEGLECAILAPATDPDGERIEYRYRWWKDGVVQPKASEARMPPGLTRPNDIWQCGVVASDGQLNSPLIRSQEVLVRAAGM
ncbi:MAG: VCBS repeat-containing protein [Deltaproteobacteria bacterium]|nr:VCBS repeat-containing protein [Deltaproteobacteria bacterium]